MINEQIRINECRLIGNDGTAYGIVSVQEARAKAAEEALQSAIDDEAARATSAETALQAAIEAILFASGEPIELERIAEALEIEPEVCEQVILNLSAKNILLP